MKPAPLTPIPTPLAQRLRDLRLRWLPLIVIAGCITAIALLWRDNISAPQLTGQAEPVLASLSSYKPGTIAALNVVRFQKVKAGEVLGKVLTTDPKLIEASLAVARAEIEQIRAGLLPVTLQQRAAVDYAQLRLDWMRQRATLAGARVNLQLAEVESRRAQELFDAKVAPQRSLDIAKSAQDSLQQQVNELEKLVTEGEKSLAEITPADTKNPAQVSIDPLRAAIELQEAKLHQIEEEFAPIPLLAPLDGIITAINHRPGESVTAGEPILSVASQTPTRIVGYLRSPNLDAAKPGMKVRIRTRNLPRITGLAQVTEVGLQLETPPAALASPLKMTADLGLPVEISLPEHLKLRPGELVDMTLLAEDTTPTAAAR